MPDKKTGFAASALVLVLIFAVFALVLFGINIFAAPLIEANGSAQQFAPLYSVMPEAKGFELIYDANDSAASALVDVPETVQAIYSETSGLGYAIRLSTTQGYTKEPIEFTIAIDAEGKISGTELTAYPDTKDFGADYPGSFIGQDSALGDVGLVAGVTYSSSAFKNAVSDGFAALIGNGLVGAGVKSDAQILTELSVQVFTGLANRDGVAQVEEPEIAEGQFTFIQKIMKALNGSGFAFVAKDGESSYLLIANVSGTVRVYDIEGKDVTETANAAMVEEASSYAAANTVSTADAELKKLRTMVSEGAELTALSLGDAFNSVTGAYRIADGETTLYGFCARPYAYSNQPIAVYFVLDENGAIVSMASDEIILFGEYFTSYELDESQYKEGFAGLTADSFTGEQTLISGATASTNAMTVATEDVFAAFQAISATDGGNN
ncbi:MAG: FMN-binding protein [Candidatus Limivicinus sp.]|nr:FMN-binding protein [Clostridiales bacterium]MDY6133575.1 FMN-binding protein [Candidatus Limivicinus sp.]